MKRTYELLAFLKPIMDADNSEGTLKNVKTAIEKNNGKISKEDKAGRKRLAYPIQKFKDAFMATLIFDIDPKDLDGLNEQLRLNEDLLRYMIASRTEDELKAAAKRAENPAPARGPARGGNRRRA